VMVTLIYKIKFIMPKYVPM